MNYEFNFSLYRELLILSKEQAIDDGDLERSFSLITECLARSLGVARASVWIYNDDRSAIVCKDLYERDFGRHSSGLELKAKDFPAYFNYLLEERTLPAHDAHSDPATHEFSECYLKPLGIMSMLDAPIRVGGKMIGVLCCEQVKTMRQWSLYEESFAGNISDILSRAFQACERTSAQNELKKMNADLEEIVKQRTNEIKDIFIRTAESARLISLGEMAGGIAHEVNTPLNSILFAAECVREIVESPTEIDANELVEHMRLIEETALRIAKIIQGLKWFAQDQKTHVYELYDLRLIVEQSLDLCQQKFKNGNVVIRWPRPESEKNVLCQPVQIGQVILNLLNNAFDAAADDKNGWIQIEIKESSSLTTIEVSNSGQKISDKVREKLFQPFFTTKGPSKGTGLGLSISRGIVQQHGGEIRIETDRSNTCFAVQLPRFAEVKAS